VIDLLVGRGVLLAGRTFKMLWHYEVIWESAEPYLHHGTLAPWRNKPKYLKRWWLWVDSNYRPRHYECHH